MVSNDINYKELKEYVDNTNLKGENLTFLSELDREEITNLFEAASMLEECIKDGLKIMEGKQLASFFFEPSTRTRLSTETAMNKLGGSVITEANPLENSSAAKDESLWDTLKVISQYADILVLRHPNSDRVLQDLPASEIPVISGGYGSITHPTQGLLDLYTVWKNKGEVEGMKVLITSPDLSRARSGQSFALGLAQMGAEIVYASPKELPTPEDIKDQLEEYEAEYTEHFDVSREEHDLLVKESDVVYLPGCRIPKGGEERELYMEHKDNYYVDLETLQEAKSEGNTVGIMHSLPRFDGEFDFNIDDTEHELYFDQVGNGVPVRMALITSMIGF